MKLWSTPSGRRRSTIPLVVAAALASGACVTRGAHEEAVGSLERDVERLEGEVRDLRRSNESLGEERVRLIDGMEDLRQERETLARDVAELSKTKAMLSEHLARRDAQVEELSKATATYRGLVDDLEAEVASGEIEIEQLREGIRLNLAQDILFRSGAARLEGSGVAVLRKVAAQLQEITHTIEVQGHTDDVPLSGPLERRYGSNWELAAARASSVVRLFEAEGIAPARLVAVSYGEYAPVQSNETPEGRAYNRRIEIRLNPVDASVVEADAAESGGGEQEEGVDTAAP